MRSSSIALSCSTRGKPTPTWPTNWCARTWAWSVPTRSSSRSIEGRLPLAQAPLIGWRAYPRREVARGAFREESRCFTRDKRPGHPASAPAAALQGEQGADAPILSRDAAHPPLRGARGAAVWTWADRRLLPPVHRPGGGVGWAAVGDDGRQGQRHHRLSRPWAHARLRNRPEGDHGRADGP